MKRPKLFLGITTAILAIAGVTAAKHYGPQATRFYISSGGAYCLSVTGITCTNVGNTQCQYRTAPAPLGKLVNLYTKGPQGPISGTNACISTSALKYQLEP